MSDTSAARGKSCAGNAPVVASLVAPLAAPHTSAMELASWNQEELDTDTQELFADSPPQQVDPPHVVRVARLASKSAVGGD